MDVSTACMSTSMFQSSSHFLNELTDDASMTNAVSLFYVLITLWLKKHCLSLHLFIFSFYLCPLNAYPLPLSNLKKNWSILSLSKPFGIRKTWIKSPLVSLFSRDVMSNKHNLSQPFNQLGWPTLNLKPWMVWDLQNCKLLVDQRLPNAYWIS